MRVVGPAERYDTVTMSGARISGRTSCCGAANWRAALERAQFGNLDHRDDKPSAWIDYLTA